MKPAGAPRVTAVSGSLRSGSYNRLLLRLAAGYAAGYGAEVEELDLKTLALPMYDEDMEAVGLPGSVRHLKQSVEAADVLLIASPEYNYSLSAALKNAIDWASRGGNSFKGKSAAVFGASDGPYGTVRGQQHLRFILTAVNVLVLPGPQVFVKNGREAFGPGGTLRDARTAERLKELVRATLETAGKLSGSKRG